MVAVGCIRSKENLPLVVFVDGYACVAIPTAVLVLEELCVRSNPFREQPQVIAMLARNVLEGDKQVGPTMSSAERDPVMIRTAHGARLLPSLLPTR